MKPYLRKIVICLIPIALAAFAVGHAYSLYQNGQGGFKLGVDLVGGTILVYEIDPDRKPDNYKPEQLAAALKRRIDPADLYNVTIRPVSNTRFEIILPTGGKHQAEVEEASWNDLVNQVKEKWAPPKGKDLDASRGRVQELVARVVEQHPDVPVADIEKFINDNYKESKERKHLTGEEVQNVKELISRVGSLEFRILANDQDDKEALEAAKKYFADAKSNPAAKAQLDSLGIVSRQPPAPTPPNGKDFETPLGRYTYSWVELGPSERHYLGIDNAAEKDATPNNFWKQVADARAKGETVPTSQGFLIYSRPCLNPRLPEKDRDKKFEYFVLTRDPEKGKEITGQYLTSASESSDNKGKLAVAFRFNQRGGDLFYEVTSKNVPKSSSGGGGFHRHLAIILDGLIMSAPSLNAAISTDGIITGEFTKNQVDRLVSILRSGALPATLKPLPVSENTIGPTLGDDTIRAGTRSVGLAFLAILIFMLVYYRFAGFVACVALLANLLLTVGFMVVVHATFTLPGLAGLVLMLGMAVDANVLIYERLREERDRGASLALAIRNGYDRAFPTIIDTHLSSIFTAIVLYAVGNDQLKGFGVSLTAGLIISLFTSLYMTRLMFDVWLARNWIHKLSMYRFFSRPNWDFMGIRYYFFTATIVMTVVGAAIFIFRLPEGLNIDFNGGTAFGGQLVKPLDIRELRDLLSEGRQKKLLAVGDVKKLDTDGHAFEITYLDGAKRTVYLANQASEEQLKQQRAVQLPDLSVEQIFLTATDSQEDSKGEPVDSKKSRFFTVRTGEKEADLVQASIDRLLRDEKDGKMVSLLKKIDLKAFQITEKAKKATLQFSDFASPAQVSMLLEKQLEKAEILKQAGQQFALEGLGKNQEGRYQEMRLTFVKPVEEKGTSLEKALEATQREFNARPQPERLENFDSQLARETQTRAMYAILASWAAILLYLWFRFGSWTFGLAAVLCLIHDLFFTLGIIAFCHYLHGTFFGELFQLQDFKIDLPAVAALLTLVGYSVNDTIVVFDRIREVRGKNPELTAQMINDSVNQTLSRTLLTSFATWLVVGVLYFFGGEGVHLFAFCMVIGVIVGTYSSIYIASPLLLIFGEGARPGAIRQRVTQPVPAPA